MAHADVLQPGSIRVGFYEQLHVVLLYHILFILYMFACNVMYCTHTTSNRYTPRFLRKKKLVFIKNNLQALKLMY